MRGNAKNMKAPARERFVAVLRADAQPRRSKSPPRMPWRYGTKGNFCPGVPLTGHHTHTRGSEESKAGFVYS